MLKEKFNYWEQKIEDQPIENVRNKLVDCYGCNESINNDKIIEIRQELDKIPNLLINFDETMTSESTIGAIVSALKILPQYENLNIEKRWELFNAHLADLKKFTLDNVHPLADKRGVVKFFYEEVLSGVKQEDLLKIYRDISKDIELNPNLGKVFKFLKKKAGLAEIPLVVLSLNNKDFIMAYYEAHKEFFDRHKAIIIGFIDNQARCNEDGKIIGVIEHVTNENKCKYVPDRALMLADSRETKQLLQAGINTINIQGKKFDEIFIEEACNFSVNIDRKRQLTEQLRAVGFSAEADEINGEINKIEQIIKQSISSRLMIENSDSDKNEINELIGLIDKMRRKL